MDILRFVNSKDIRKHLETIGYEFNSLETAWLIYQCRDATIDEKHKAWTELMEPEDDVISIKCTKMQLDRLNTWQVAYITTSFDILRFDPGRIENDDEEDIYWGVLKGFGLIFQRLFIRAISFGIQGFQTVCVTVRLLQPVFVLTVLKAIR